MESRIYEDDSGNGIGRLLQISSECRILILSLNKFTAEEAATADTKILTAVTIMTWSSSIRFPYQKEKREKAFSLFLYAERKEKEKRELSSHFIV